MNEDRLTAILGGLSAGDAASIARLITWAENQDPRVEEVLRRVFVETGGAYRVGITGPPGAGKSTLIEPLVLASRARGARVAVVAVDPTSPFTGGALLGDRIRMGGLAGDPGVFVRSMASRGSLGGLATATADALDLLDAAGYRELIVETVGVGQLELDVAMAADTVVVVLVPESGDGVQTMKAGLMEIGDVFVVNKADREGAHLLARDMETMLGMAPAREGWIPPVVQASARTGRGVDEVIRAMEAHRAHRIAAGGLEARRKTALRERILGEARRGLLERMEAGDASKLDALVERVVRREISPREAAEALLGTRG